jgi:hypothetical protein
LGGLFINSQLNKIGKYIFGGKFGGFAADASRGVTQKPVGPKQAQDDNEMI